MTDPVESITIKPDGIAQDYESLMAATESEKEFQAALSPLGQLALNQAPIVHPLIGKTVLYVLPEDPRLDSRSVGQVRPAIVLRAWSDTCVQLHVLLDGTNDLCDGHKDARYAAAYITEAAWACSRDLDLAGKPGTWRPIA